LVISDILTNKLFSFFPKDICTHNCSKERISERRLLALIAGLMLIFLLAIQALQNVNEGICCGSDQDPYDKKRFGSTIGMQNLN